MPSGRHARTIAAVPHSIPREERVDMKTIVAMVQPFRLGKVTGALEEITGFPA